MPYPFQQLGGATSIQPGGGGFQEQQGGAVPMAQGGNTWFTQNAPQNTGVTGGGGQTYGAGQFPGLDKLGVSGDQNDPATIKAFIDNRIMATQGRQATQSDYDYWLPNIQKVGGLGTGEYWYNKMTDPSGTGANAGGGGGGGGFGASDVMQQDPGYQFARDEGIKGIERAAAAKGTLETGGTLKDIAQYSTGLASQRYGDIFNRNLSLADLGLNAASRQAQLGSSYGQQAGADLAGYGNAAAAGSINQGNIWGGMLNNFGGLYMRPQSGLGGLGTGTYGNLVGQPVSGPIPGMSLTQPTY